MTDTEREWHEDGERNGWSLPAKAPSWKRLPVIRHVRTIVNAWRVDQHESVWRSVGMTPTGFDHWVLFGMWRGWV
jgi:hypothetical protein